MGSRFREIDAGDAIDAKRVETIQVTRNANTGTAIIEFISDDARIIRLSIDAEDLPKFAEVA